MKRKLFFILLLVVPVLQLYAQDWACVDSNRVPLFTNGANNLRGMRIDSTAAGPGFTYLFPYHTVRKRLCSPATPPDSLGASWFGKAIRAYPDGTWLFGSFLGDTLVIKTAAGIGDSWQFYSDSGSVFYTATVTAISAQPISGDMDSVKSILLTAHNAAGPVITDSLNNRQLLLSKRHGFVLVPDLYMWPYHRPGQPYNPCEDYFTNKTGGPLVSQHFFRRLNNPLPRWSDVFNYQPGDVLQTYRNFFQQTTNNYTINTHLLDSFISRSSSAAGVYYQYHRAEFGLYFSNNHYEQHTTDDRIATNLPLLDTMLLPEEFHNVLIWTYDEDDTSWCRTGARFGFYDYGPLPGLLLEPGLSYPYYYTYKTGIGMVRRWHGDGDGLVEILDLEYARISGQSCGHYTRLKAASAAAADHSLKLFPQPANSLLQLQSEQHLDAGVQLLDMSGRVVKVAQMHGSSLSLPVADVPAGAYVVLVSAADGERLRMIAIVGR